jgi:hypothetical protein
MTLEELVKSETARILSQLASTPIAKDTMYTVNKRKRKNHPNRTFISENLTRHRFQLACKLNFNRKHGDINSYWTLEGRIIVNLTNRLFSVPSNDDNEFDTENESQNAD